MKKFVLYFAMLVLSCNVAQAQPKEFFRVKKVDGVVKSLEVAITNYQSKDGKVKVALVGVVHIADAVYYNNLNRRLAKYDTVLYELVAPEGTKPDGKKKKDNDFLSMLPKVMCAALDLDMQLECVNYNGKNFVHADLSFEEMAKVMEERGDNKITIGLSLLVDMMRQNNLKKKDAIPQENIDFSAAIENPNILKKQMAAQMVESADLMPTMKKLLVDDRNKKTCEVMVREIGKGSKNLAIFYGAAHNADFDKRLRQDHNMVYVNQEWLAAWNNLDGEPAPLELRLLKLLMKQK